MMKEMIDNLFQVPYIFHGLVVSVVLLGAVLVFVFGFKSPEEPTFIDTKSPKKKLKKTLQNGLIISEGGKSKAKSSKAPKAESKKIVTNPPPKTPPPPEMKKEKVNNNNSNNNSKKPAADKAQKEAVLDVDEVDDGEWEAVSRKDKKHRKVISDSPKKSPKNDKKAENESEGKKIKRKPRKEL